MKILGSALWTDPTLANEPTLTGAWFAAPPAGAWTAFAQRYRASFGTIRRGWRASPMTRST